MDFAPLVATIGLSTYMTSLGGDNCGLVWFGYDMAVLDTAIGKLIPSCGVNLRDSIVKAETVSDLWSKLDFSNLFSCEETHADHRNWQRIEILSGSLVQALAEMLGHETILSNPYYVYDSKCFGDINWNLSLVPALDSDSRRMRWKV